MISVAEALEKIFALAQPTGTEFVPLQDAAGRVLAADVLATRDQPPFNASAMDGYAVRRQDRVPGAALTVVGEAAAGGGFSGDLGAGGAVRIFTGAPVPKGADCVVIQEDVLREGDRITLRQQLDTADHIRPAGGDFRIGDRLAAPRRLGPPEIGLLAAMNSPTVPVHRKPIVALIATGDELVMPGETPAETQILSSNNFALKALVEMQGAEARMLPIARDNADSLAQTLEFASDADLIVTLGGASVGDYDLVQQVAGGLGLELGFYKVAMRPGKPLMAGRLRGVPMIGLPGNPVSAIVCGHVFLRPLIDAMQGMPCQPLPRASARLACDVAANGPREHYMRATLLPEGICPAPRQDSSLLGVLGASNALLVRPAGDQARLAGTEVEYITL